MDNVKNISSQEELLKLRNEGKITEAEYKELLSEISKVPKKLPMVEINSQPVKGKGLGIASFILSIAGILVPFLIFIIMSNFIKKNPSDDNKTLIIILLFLTFVTEIIALVLGILSWKTTFGKAGAIISGILLIFLILFTMYFTVSIQVTVPEKSSV